MPDWPLVGGGRRIVRGATMIRRRLRLAPLFLVAALALVPWIGWLGTSLPCRYVSHHWGVAWAGFDVGLALALGLTGFAALVRAAWLDRAAVAAGTLLVADAWFDVVTSRGADAVALATVEALSLELPLALLCIWVVHAVAASRPSQLTSSRPATNAEHAEVRGSLPKRVPPPRELQLPVRVARSSQVSRTS